MWLIIIFLDSSVSNQLIKNSSQKENSWRYNVDMPVQRKQYIIAFVEDQLATFVWRQEF